LDIVAFSAALLASSVLVGTAGSSLRLPGGMKMKDSTEELLNKTGKRFGNEMSNTLLRKKFTQANINMQPEYFTGLQIALPVFTLVAFLPLSLLGVLDIYWAVLPAVLLYFAPGVWLNGKINKRVSALKADVSDFCNLLANALTSGAHFVMALGEVSRVMGGELSGEIQRVLADISTGKSRALALKEMAARCGIPELSSLVRKIEQAMRYDSAKLPETVKHHADKILSKQKHEVTKTAGVLNIKLLFPIVIFILSSLLIDLLFPVGWNIFSAF